MERTEIKTDLILINPRIKNCDMTLVRVLFVKGYLHTCTQNEPMLESVRGLPEKAYGLVFNLDSLICLPVYLLII